MLLHNNRDDWESESISLVDSGSNRRSTVSISFDRFLLDLDTYMLRRRPLPEYFIGGSH
jgi:hypothetical protein